MIMKTKDSIIPGGCAGYASPEMTSAEVVTEKGFATSGEEGYMFGVPDYEEGINF